MVPYASTIYTPLFIQVNLTAPCLLLPELIGVCTDPLAAPGGEWPAVYVLRRVLDVCIGCVVHAVHRGLREADNVGYGGVGRVREVHQAEEEMIGRPRKPHVVDVVHENPGCAA